MIKILFFIMSLCLSQPAFAHMDASEAIDANLLSNYFTDISHGSSIAFIGLLGISFIFGALHSLAPGHGNILVASYFTSRKARIYQGVLMAAIIALSHVISAVAIVVATEYFAEYVMQETHMESLEIIELISYSAILAIGCFMLYVTYKNRGQHSCMCCGHHQEEEHVKNKSYFLLAVTIGAVPCASTMLLLFYAMSQNMLMVGIYMVISLSAGMGVMLAAIGVASILAHRKIIEHKAKEKSSEATAILHYIGAIVVIIFGLVSVISTLLEM